MLKCKVFGRNCPKTLHLPRERRGAPVEIRIETMAKFHKSGSKEPFLWNCAATAARINRKAVYSVDIIVGLSNILDSEHNGRKPVERPHGKVVGTAVMDSKLRFEVCKRIETAAGIVTFLVFPVAAL